MDHEWHWQARDPKERQTEHSLWDPKEPPNELSPAVGDLLKTERQVPADQDAHRKYQPKSEEPNPFAGPETTGCDCGSEPPAPSELDAPEHPLMAEECWKADVLHRAAAEVQKHCVREKTLLMLALGCGCVDPKVRRWRALKDQTVVLEVEKEVDHLG